MEFNVIKLQVDHAYHEIVLNMNEVLIKIVRYFGPVACAIYDVEYESV